MKPLSAFMTRILPHVAGCPDVTAQEALVDTAIEFCEKTQIVQQTLAPISTVINTLSYTVTGPTDQVVAMPVGVWFKTVPLEPVPVHEIENVQAFNPDLPDTDLFTGIPICFVWTAPATIALYPIPDESEADVVTVRASLKPSRTATTLADVLFDDWCDALVHGTLARLHMFKDQPWASADRALLHAREFRGYVQRARIEQSKGRVRTSMRVVPMRF
jgi:hypothetical protein